MTNERAIELLHRLQDEQFDGQHGDERREALEMAVRALFSQQIVNDSQGLVNDCISRQQAIDAVKSRKTAEPCKEGKTRNWTVYLCIDVLEKLPSAQSQRKKGKWIYHSNWEADGECGYECSECGMGSDVDYGYCMRCGARMDGESE